MITPQQRSRSPEGGFTLVELSVAAFLSTLVLSAVVLIFNSVSRGASDAASRGDLQMQAREVITEIAAELRSAEAPRLSATAVESLSSSVLIFHTDRYPAAGPERIVYERTSCVGGYCQLRVRRYAANPASGPNWTYQTVPFNDVVLLDRVSAGNTLFSGRVWSGTPSRLTTVASCGGATKCLFPIVAIDLQAAAPAGNSLAGPFGVFVEVNLRNA